ncbi:MAG: ArdC-like ssDNA-binding domain-containing protein [Ruminococcus sp.]
MARSLNVYEMVTERIIKQLEQGTIPWQKPWTGVRSGAFNRVSKKPYSLINQAILKNPGGVTQRCLVILKALSKKRFSNLGETTNFPEDQVMKKKQSSRIENTLLRYYNVFHISQVEGVEPLKEKLNTEIEPIEEADRIIKNYVDREHITFKECISDKTT